MAALNVRNLSDEIIRAQHISAAGETRVILDNPVNPANQIGLGSMLAAIGRDFGGVDLDTARDKTAAEPATFEWSSS